MRKLAAGSCYSFRRPDTVTLLESTTPPTASMPSAHTHLLNKISVAVVTVVMTVREQAGCEPHARRGRGSGGGGRYGTNQQHGAVVDSVSAVERRCRAG